MLLGGGYDFPRFAGRCRGAQFIETVVDEGPLRRSMYRFSRNLLIVGLGIGILTATLVNHFAAGILGAWLTAVISPQAMRWILGITSLALRGRESFVRIKE